jgi:sugar phosphate permease
MNQMIMAGLGSQGLGTYLIPLQGEFGWSKTTLGAARSLMQVSMGVTEPIVGFVVDRLGPRLLMALGSFIFGLGLVLFSFVHTVWEYYVVSVILGLGTSLGGFLVMTVAVNNWFRRKRTLALSLAQLGQSVGGIVVIPLLVWVQITYGWRDAAFASGLAVWAIGIPSALLMRRSPEEHDLEPDGIRSKHRSSVRVEMGKRPVNANQNDFTLIQAMHTRAFWLIAVGHGLAVMVVSAATVHQFAHMEEGVGLSRGTAALVITILSGSTIIGRIVGGVLGDRLPKQILAALGMAGSAGALVILAMASSLGPALAYGIIHGISWGMRGPLMSAMRADYFGRTHFGKIYGVSLVLIAAGSMLGPIFAGVMADLLGNYQLGFIILAGISGAGSVLFLITRSPNLPRELGV